MTMYGDRQYHKIKISFYGVNILYTFQILKLCLAIGNKKVLLPQYILEVIFRKCAWLDTSISLTLQSHKWGKQITDL